MPPDDENDRSKMPSVETPDWQTAFLVCKKCRKRKHAPALKAKAVSSTIRHYLPRDKPRPRVVFTSCLGLCPQGAIAVACIGGSQAPRVISVSSSDDLEGALPLLYPM